MLYDGRTTDERLKAITGICNLEWFTRVWTTTEYVQSHHVISMDGEGNVCSRRNDPIFLIKMLQVWFEEGQRHPSIHDLEARAGIGKNIVPWNLGPLLDMGEAKSSVFGQAFALLSKRRCQSNYDFLHALLGLVKPTTERPLERDFVLEYEYIARLCLAVGDYSPLLLTPRFEKDIRSRWEIIQGFNDLGVWPVGAGMRLSDFHNDFSFENDDLMSRDPILKLQKIGMVVQVNDHLGADPMLDFAHDATFVLKTTGPDLDSFIETLGWRLYDERVEIINQKLAAENLRDSLARVIQEEYKKEKQDDWAIEGPRGTRWVAQAMTLSLKDSGGGKSEPFSRLAYLNAHGATIHAAYAGGNRLISVSCTACHQIFIFRAALFEPPLDVVGSTAYRIPSLRYQYSHPNGMGIFVKDGRIVGRLAWATPACECWEVEMVKLKIPALPCRRPRPRDLDID